MKLLLFVALFLITTSAYTVELSSCTDASGNTHYTNLPHHSLDSNCKTKDHYEVMLQQDYDNLAILYSKYEIQSDDDNFDNETSEPFKLSEVDISPDSIKNKVSDIFDADKAFDQLMEATEDRDDVFTRAIRGRTEGIKNIIEEGNKN